MYSPMLQRHIALARVRPELAAPGHEVRLEFDVNHRYEYVTARTARLPLYNPSTKDGLTCRRRRPRRPTEEPSPSRPRPAPTDRTYDAIVIGGGHNGLVNGAYLAKAGLKTLILERRHSSAARPSPRSCCPGFWFTTFSYALSLLRPDIIHDLELTKHGFMPLLMSSTFAPMENGDYLWLGQDHGAEPQGDRAPQQARRRRLRPVRARHGDGLPGASSRCSTRPPPDLFSDDPEELLALAALGSRFRKMDKRTLHNTVRLLTGSAADFLDDYFESDILKGYLASSSIIGTKVGPRSQGSGLVLLYHSIGEHDGEFGAWAFHKGGNGGFTKVLARAAAVVRGRDRPRVAGRRRSSPRTAGRSGVALADGTEYHAKTVVSALDPRRTFLELVDPRELPSDLVETIQRFRFQGTSSKVNFALDGLPKYPALRRPRRPVPRLHEHRAVDGLPRARLRRRQVRLVQPAAVHGLRDPVDDRRRHGAARQARHEHVHRSTRRTSCARATGTPSGRTWATPSRRRSSRSSRASATSSSTARSSPRSTSSGPSGSRKGNIFAGEFLAPQMYFFRPAPGWSQYRTPIDGYYQCGSGTHPGRLRHGRAGQARGGADPQGPRPGLTCLGHEDPRLTAARARTRRGALSSVSVRSGGRRSRGVSRSTCQRTGSSSWTPRGHSKSIRGTIRSSRLAPSGITMIRRRRRASGMKTKSSAPMSARSRFTAASLPALRRCYLQTSIN